MLLTRMFKGTLPDDGQISAFRRLHFEAHTLSVAELREKVTRTEDSAPRKLVAPERNARYESQKLRYPHLNLEGELEISHGLLDEIMQMAEDDTLHYVAIDRCTRRDQEVAGKKRDTSLKLDALGSLKLHDDTVPPSADLASDWKVRVALMRRALAFDQASLVKYSVFEGWHTQLYIHINRLPPPGYAQVDLAQALRADQELFRRMFEKTRGGIRQLANGTKPLETAMLMAVGDPSVTHMLLPLPLTGSGHKSSTPKIPVVKTPKVKAAAKSKSRGGGKGVKGGKGASAESPEHYLKKDAEGNNICFPFNKEGGCTYGAPGKRCGRGRHICMVPGCGQAHGAHEHAKAGA